MGDGSRRRFLCLVGGKKITKKKHFRSQIFSCRKHLKILVALWAEKLLIWGKNILSSQHVGGKNKIKLKCQFFSRWGQLYLIGGLVAHTIYWDWPYRGGGREANAPYTLVRKSHFCHLFCSMCHLLWNVHWAKFWSEVSAIAFCDTWNGKSSPIQNSKVQYYNQQIYTRLFQVNGWISIYSVYFLQFCLSVSLSPTLQLELLDLGPWICYQTLLVHSLPIFIGSWPKRGMKSRVHRFLSWESCLRTYGLLQHTANL